LFDVATRFDGLVPWLTALRLSEYIETFQLHGFTSTERLHNLWDVELTSVLNSAYFMCMLLRNLSIVHAWWLKYLPPYFSCRVEAYLGLWKKIIEKW
jgi:SAM domain (Sterile alpha motif)